MPADSAEKRAGGEVKINITKQACLCGKGIMRHYLAKNSSKALVYLRQCCIEREAHMKLSSFFGVGSKS